MIPAFAALLAVISAVFESERIDAGRDIHHGMLATIRVILVLAFAAMCWLLLSLQWVDLALQLAMSPAVFAIIHRILLNALRRPVLQPWYMSPSNRYDWLWITLAKWRVTGQFIYRERLAWQLTHRSLFFVLQDKDYRKIIEYSGRMAMKAELGITMGLLALRLIIG